MHGLRRLRPDDRLLVTETMSPRGKHILEAKRQRAKAAWAYHRFGDPRMEDRIIALTRWINFVARRTLV